MKKVFLFCMIVLLMVGMGAMPAQSLAKGPIKIGFFGPLTGFAAQTGKDMLAGLKLHLKEKNYQVSGRKIELFAEDSEAKPAVALTKVRKLVEQNGVHILAGGLMASTGYALKPYVERVKIPTLYPVIASDNLTQRDRGKWIVRNGFNSSQASHPFGVYAAKKLGFRKIVTIGFDYAYAWEVIGGFHRTFEESGGRIIQKLWAPVGNMDFGPYLGQIDRNADAVYALVFGAGALQFVKQYKDFGLKAKIPLIGGGSFTDEHVLRSMGDEAIGIITALQYSGALDTPANKEFVENITNFTGKGPSHLVELFYTCGKWITQSVAKINGEVEDRERFLGALKSLNVTDAPRGPIEMDEFGNPIQNQYIRKVEKVGNALQNTVIYTYPRVSQFWNYDVDWFLKQPLYSRDYPPMK
jgi:branched-chain amino acid transport system substrate-binding protein